MTFLCLTEVRKDRPPRSIRFRILTGLVIALVFQPNSARAENTPTRYEQDLAAFLKEMDTTYPFFDLKGIRADWESAKPKLLEQVKACKTDADFLAVICKAIDCLRDAHMGISDTKVKLPPSPPEYYPGVSFLPAMQGRVVVMDARKELAGVLKPGTVVLDIDGKDARKLLDENSQLAWAAGGNFSSPQRAGLFEYRIPLRGKKGEKHTLTIVAGTGKKTVSITSDMEASGWPHTYNLPQNLKTHSKTCQYAKLPSGAGYIYLRYIDGDTEPGIAAALTALPDAKGWIVDLCGNGGGGYDDALLKSIETIPKPVAVVIDAGCISAGETLARDLKKLTGARLFGSATAGASSAKRQWTFPSGIATITMATRSRFGPDGKPIEFNGIHPDEEVQVVPEEVQKGQNSALLRAQEYIAKMLKPSAQ